MKNRKLKFFTLCIALLPVFVALLPAAFLEADAAALTRTWDGGGATNNWSEAANWTGDSVPTSSDDIVFDGTSTKDATVDIAVGINRININTGYTGTISIADGMSLTTTGGDSSQSDGAINVGNGSLSFGSTNSFVLNGGTINGGNGTISFFFFFTINGGNFNGAGATVPSISLAGPVIIANGGNFIAPESLTVRGLEVAVSAGFDHNNGTIVTIGGNSAFISSSARTLNNLTVSNNDDGGISTNANTTVVGTLTLNDGLINSGTLRALGPVSISPNFGSVSQGGGGGDLLIESGPGARTIDFQAGTRLPNVRINDPNVSIVSSGSGTVDTDDLWLQSFVSADFGANDLRVGRPGVTDGAPFRMDEGNLTFTTGDFIKGTFGTVTLNNGTITLGTGEANMAASQGMFMTGGVFNAPTGPTTIAGLAQSGGTFNGNGMLDINGSFALSGGVFNASPTNTNFGFFFDITGGTFNHNNGTVIFDPTHPAFSMNVTTNGGVGTFNNIVFNPTTDNAQISFNNRTFRAIGSLQILNGQMNTGVFEVAGDLTIGPGADGGSIEIGIIGSGPQTFTNNGGLNSTGIWTVNKTSGTVTAATDLLLAANQTLNIFSGTLYLANGSDLTVGPVNVLAAGRLINDSSTTITLGGNVGNAGNIFLLGSGAACPQADTILIRSSVNGTQRNWTGGGSFALKDVDVRDMAGTAPIIAYNSTDSGTNGANWTFDAGCPPNVSISPQVLSIYRNQTQTFTAGGGFGNKTFSLAVNNSGATIDPTTGLYAPGNSINVIDTVRATDAFGQFADAQATVIAGPPTRLAMAVQPPASVTAGATMSPPIQVALQDEFGNTVPNATNPVTISLLNNPGGSTLSGTLTRNAVNGIATFDDISLNRAGTDYDFRLTSPNLIETSSAAFDVNAGPASQLIFGVQPSDTEALSVIAPPITVEVTDTLGNRVTSATNLITMSIGTNPAGGSLTGTAQRTAVAGVATFIDLQINNFGDGYTLAANAAGLAGASSQPFNVLSPFVVLNTNDTGPGSFRNAITKANQVPGPQTVTFNIPGPNPHSIAAVTSLPIINETIIIDGTTQPGFAGTPIIELDGVSRSAGGLTIRADNCVVRGLAINRFTSAILTGSPLSSNVGNGTVIQGNHIGIDLTGTVARGNNVGIHILSDNNIIGGSQTAEGNLISGNILEGIRLSDGADGNTIQGNRIGTNASGDSGVQNNIGISLGGGLGSGSNVGGIANGEANIVAFNIRGIVVSTFAPISIRGNSIHSNGFQGIDLHPTGVQLNDPGDNDTGVNQKQNFPVIDFATGGTSTQIVGILNSRPSSTYALDFYSNDACDASGYGEGRTYIGSTDVTTNASNLASFDVTFPVATPVGHFITATATDSLGNTSEFSQCRETSPSVVTISGRVTDSGGASLRAARLRLAGPRGTKEVLTDALGNFSFRNVASAASYTLSASRANYDFAPPTRMYTNITGDQLNQGFVGTKNRSSISGTVRGLVNGVPISLSGVTVTLSGAASRSTISNGSYAFHDLPTGQYTVTAIKDGWTFNPLSIDVNLALTNVALSHLASQTTALEGRLFFSDVFPRVINANGTAELFVNFRRIKLGFDASPDGRKIAYVGDKYHEPTGRDTVYTANSDGTEESLIFGSSTSSSSLSSPRFSPDGSKVVYIFHPSGPGLNSLRIRDLVAGTTTIVSTGAISFVGSPGWISSTRLAFHGFDGNDYEIYSVNTNGTNLVRLTDNSGPDQNPSVSYDGSRIAYNSFDLGNNTLSVMNSDGSNLQFLRTDVFQGGIGWSPDGTMLAIVRVFPNMNNSLVYSIINASNGSLIRDFATLGASSPPFFDWAPDIETATPAGVNVPVVAGGVDITFSGVTTAGTTTVTPIPPSSAGTAPNGFVLGGIAYEITTTAAYTAPVTICFNVPTTVASTQTAFNALSLMHNEGGVLVDRTSSRDFPSRTICGSVTTLSPFVVAEQVDALLPSITGYVADSGGSPISNVTVQLTGAEDRFTQTDVDGFFTFVNLTEGESYTVQPKQLGYLFSEYSEDFFAVTGENSVVFTGTQANFSISGRAVDSSGIPLSGKVVEIEGASNGSTLTDSNGDFVFSGLPADGGYEVRLFAGNQENFSPAFYAIDPLTTDLSGFDFTELAPTAASVSIGGRVVSAGGPGIRNAVVTITDQNSNTRIVRTGSAGYYRFDGIPVGQTVIISIKSRRFTFAHPTRIVNVTDELTDVDFVSDTLE